MSVRLVAWLFPPALDRRRDREADSLGVMQSQQTGAIIASINQTWHRIFSLSSGINKKQAGIWT